MDSAAGPTPPELQAIVERIRTCAQDATPLCIRGGGSKDFYGGPLVGEPLDVSPLCGISSYEPSELVVTVRAGTPLAQLESVLAQQGQCLPFEPPRFGPAASGTVGGMVAAGLSGPARASVGAVRDYVLGASMINGRGELLTFGGQVMKNVAGYDVSRVLAGSLGVLGVITELSLKVLPAAPAEATLAFQCTQAEALARLNQWGGQPLPLNASCWAQQQDGQGWLYLRLRGAVAAVEAACRQLGGDRGEPAPSAASWQALRDQQLPFFAARAPGDELWRVSVPQTVPVLALDGEPLVEWHGGQRWYVLPSGRAQQVREAARAAGGHATLFAGGEADGRAAAFGRLSPPLAKIHAALKREFDPAGIFNRGRLLPDL